MVEVGISKLRRDYRVWAGMTEGGGGFCSLMVIPVLTVQNLSKNGRDIFNRFRAKRISIWTLQYL
jgi:hypothetical protein